MNHNDITKEYELIYVIVNNGYGSKVLKYSREHGITGGTIFLGKGTIKNRILELLDLCEMRKEIIMMLAEKKLAYTVMEELNNRFHFDKPNHGITFSIPAKGFLGVNGVNSKINENLGEDNIMYNSILTVVDKGNAELVIDAANKAGARGGTIINARGAGTHETTRVFSMDIEPEKEIVLILSDINSTQEIVDAINLELKIEEPGNGIIMIQNVSKTYGIY
ncbi:MAG: P-II family nitrogen regulator [Clostridiales bacterium]|nr:P-II family nitrogen regulator [Clostridiales bacterium]